jgi:hydroxymethylglutaryl-CoA synthase
MAAVEWIASGAAAGRAALVICADVARYGMHTAGEPTQGGGAVAMVIAENPAMLELDVGVTGAASTHVHDFWRPIGQREARVDGHYSMQCYTEALATAYRGWKTRAIARELVRDGASSEQLARICYHVPFCKMAKKAHAAVRACDGVADDPASYQAQVEPSLWACSRVGNIYTGSLYLALLGALDRDAATLAGKRIGLFSYGSGCTSEFFSGVVGARAAELTAKAKLGEVLADRERITIDEYERIMTLVTPLENRHAAFRFTGVDEHRRQYAR